MQDAGPDSDPYRQAGHDESGQPRRLPHALPLGSSFDVPHYMNFRRRVASYEEFVREIESLLRT